MLFRPIILKFHFHLAVNQFNYPRILFRLRRSARKYRSPRWLSVHRLISGLCTQDPRQLVQQLDTSYLPEISRIITFANLGETQPVGYPLTICRINSLDETSREQSNPFLACRREKNEEEEEKKKKEKHLPIALSDRTNEETPRDSTSINAALSEHARRRSQNVRKEKFPTYLRTTKNISTRGGRRKKDTVTDNQMCFPRESSSYPRFS